MRPYTVETRLIRIRLNIKGKRPRNEDEGGVALNSMWIQWTCIIVCILWCTLCSWRYLAPCTVYSTTPRGSWFSLHFILFRDKFLFFSRVFPHSFSVEYSDSSFLFTTSMMIMLTTFFFSSNNSYLICIIYSVFNLHSLQFLNLLLHVLFYYAVWGQLLQVRRRWGWRHLYLPSMHGKL